MADTNALLPPGADLFLSDDGTKIKGYDTTPGAGPWYAAETVREHVAPLVAELQRLRAENERLGQGLDGLKDECVKWAALHEQTQRERDDARAALAAALAAAQQPADHSSRVSVDGGALQLALSVLRRAGKTEVADALEQSGGERGAAHQPAEQMSEARMREVLLAAATEIAAELGADADGEIDEDALAMVTRYCRAVEREVLARSAGVDSATYPDLGKCLGANPEAARWRYSGTGDTYTEIGRGRLKNVSGSVESWVDAVFYRADRDGGLYARSVEQFFDGRFEHIGTAGTTGEQHV